MATKALRFLSVPLRLLAGLLALYILAVSAYHAQRIGSLNVSPSGQFYAIIIISGVAVLWALLTTVGSLLPHGVFLPILIMDLLFMGGFIAISILARRASNARCSSATIRNYSVGSYALWTKSTSTYTSRPRLRCNLDKILFAFAVANAVIFAILAFLSYRLFSRHRKNRAYGPGPENNYAVGSNTAPKGKRSGRFSNDTAMTEVTNVTAEENVTLNSGRTANTAHGYRTGGVTDHTQAGYAQPNGAGGIDPRLPHEHTTTVPRAAY